MTESVAVAGCLCRSVPATKARRCKDCPPGTKRKAPHPGPRCATHNRMARQGTRDAAHSARIEKQYGITGEQYWYLWRQQGGVCYICQRARGTSKRLSVDHDHSCCPELPACGKCVRGLLCKSCNRDVLGHLRDDPEALRRALHYLEHPPAKELLDV